MKILSRHLENVLLLIVLLLCTTCKKEEPPTVSKIEVITTRGAINVSSVVCGGEITSNNVEEIIERGVSWDTLSNPELSDNKIVSGTGPGKFSAEITNLTPGREYYLRAFAKTAIGVVYGNEISFITLGPPVLTTTLITSVTRQTALSGGNISSDGGAEITDRGLCWSLNPVPTILDSKTSNGKGVGIYTINLTDLTANTKYYVRAYALNSVGIGYGQELNFITNGFLVPTIVTSGITNITEWSAQGGGNIISDGGTPILQKGICYSDYPVNLSLESEHTKVTKDGDGQSSYTSLMYPLYQFTDYVVRAYATNSVGTGYGEVIAFKTLPGMQVAPVLLTPSNNKLNGCCTVNFTWQPSIYAELSIIEISKTSDFSGTTYSAQIECGSGGTERLRSTGVLSHTSGYPAYCIKMDDPSLDGIWYWRVRTWGSGVSGPWSVVYTFTFKY